MDLSTSSKIIFLMNKQLIHICFIAVLIVLSAQLFVHITGLIQVRNLNGEIELTAYRPPTAQSFWSGEFQREAEKSIDVQTALLPLAVRTANQINFSLFGRYTESVIITPSNHILQQSYIKAHKSEINLSKRELDTWISEVKAVQKWTEEQGGQFIYIMAANKSDIAYGSPGHPRRILNVIDSSLTANQIPHFNTQHYLLDHDHDRIFNKNGVHWSVYGATLVIDSLMDRINDSIFSIAYDIDSVVVSEKARSSDRDGEEMLNLLFPLQNETYEYPVIHAEVEGRKPVFLVIGDSFGWNFYDADLFRKIAAAGSVYRYYNNTPYDVNMSKMKEMTIPENLDVVFIIATEANLYEGAFGLDKEVSQ